MLMKITAVILGFSQFVALVNSDDEKSSLEIKKQQQYNIPHKFP